MSNMIHICTDFCLGSSLISGTTIASTMNDVIMSTNEANDMNQKRYGCKKNVSLVPGCKAYRSIEPMHSRILKDQVKQRLMFYSM